MTFIFKNAFVNQDKDFEPKPEKEAHMLYEFLINNLFSSQQEYLGYLYGLTTLAGMIFGAAIPSKSRIGFALSVPFLISSLGMELALSLEHVGRLGLLFHLLVTLALFAIVWGISAVLALTVAGFIHDELNFKSHNREHGITQ